MSRVRKQGNLKLVGSPLRLRERGRKYIAKASDMLAKGRALYEQADRIERESQSEQEDFYRRQHFETCEECKAKGVNPDSREVGFHIAHLSGHQVRRAT